MEVQSLQSGSPNWENIFEFQKCDHLYIQQQTEGSKQAPPSFQPFPQRRRWFEFEVQTKKVQMLARVENAVVNAQSKGCNPNQIHSIRPTHTTGSSSKKMNDCNKFMLCSVTALLSGLVPPTSCQSQPQDTKVSKMEKN